MAPGVDTGDVEAIVAVAGNGVVLDGQQTTVFNITVHVHAVAAVAGYGIPLYDALAAVVQRLDVEAIAAVVAQVIVEHREV